VIDITRRGDDLVIAVDGVEATVLLDLVEQLGGMLRGRAAAVAGIELPMTPDDPALARLLPDGMRDDGEARALRALIEPGLVSAKLAALDAIAGTIAAPGVLDRDAERAWLTGLNDLRLTIATRLGIEHDGDAGRGETDADLALREVYHWLGMLQQQLLDRIEERDDATVAEGDR